MKFKNYLKIDSVFEKLNEVVYDVIPSKKQSRFIDPMTQKNWRFEDRFRQLSLIIDEETDKGVDINHLWVSFSTHPRLNIHPANQNKPGKSTPTGIFAYPAKYVLQNKDNIPSFDNRDYILVIKCKKGIWEVGDVDQNFTKKLYDISINGKYEYLPRYKDLESLAISKNLNINNVISKVIKEQIPKNENEFLYCVLKVIATGDVHDKYRGVKWNKYLRDFGISNIVDTKGSSAIHSYEPSQGVFLQNKDLELISVITNKSHSDHNFSNTKTQNQRIGFYNKDNYTGLDKVKYFLKQKFDYTKQKYELNYITKTTTIHFVKKILQAVKSVLSNNNFDADLKNLEIKLNTFLGTLIKDDDLNKLN